MYRHTVDDIKETSEKVFVSSEEKKKFSMYGDRFSTIEDTYNKEELDTHISKLQVKDVTVEGEVISEKDTVSGIISDIELFGNTKQRVETITINPELTFGAIHTETGDIVDSTEHYRTDFIDVKYLDTVIYKNGDKIRSTHVHIYNDKKEYLGYYGIQESEFTINDLSAAYIRLHHYTNDSDNITLTIKRTHLDDIQSVGELLPDGKYSVKFNSLGCNIFDISSNKDIGYIYDSGVVIDHDQSWCVHDFLELPKIKKITVTESSLTYRQYRIVFYDYNKELICVESYESGSTNAYTVNVPENARYYRLSYAIKVNNTPVTRENIQVVIGDEQCEYEEYNKVSSNIVLPVQLEKIGVISDRLFRREDGVWCIEKKMRKEVISSKTHTYQIRTGFNVASIIMFFLPDGMGKSIGESSLSLKYKTMASLPFFSASSEPDGTNPWDSTSSFLHHFFTLRLNNKGTVEIIDRNLSIYFDKNWTEQQILDWVDSQNITVVYPLHEPEIIELPLDVQISLNSFNNVTNIFTTSGDLEGKVKVTIPKSLGSSIETLLGKTNKVSNSIENIMKLKNGQVIDYKSNKGCINIENNNGIVSDVFLEGQTLVNLWGTKTEDFIITNQASFNPYSRCIEYTSTENRFSNCYTKNITRYKPNTKYTIIVNVFENTFTTTSPVLRVSSDKGNGPDIGISNDKRYIKGGFVGTQVFTITTLPDLSVSIVGLRTYVDNVDSEVGAKIKFNIVVLEGDHTDKHLSYFEGLKSVGDGTDKIVVESIKGDGNLFNSDGLKYSKSLNLVVGNHYNEAHTPTDQPQKRIIGLPIRLPRNSNLKVYFKCKGYQIAHIFYDKNLRFVRDRSWCPNNIDISPRDNEVYVASYIKRDDDAVMSQSDIDYIKQNAIITESVNFESIVYTPYQSNKKALYYNKNNEWLKPVLRSLPNGVKDTIEKHSNGKYYYHKRCDEIILNGSENIEVSGVRDQNDTIAFNIRFTGSCNTQLKDNITTLSDKFKSISFDDETEDKEHVLQGFYDYQQYIRLRIIRTKLSTQDANGLKQWLQNNNVTVVYQLANEEVYECNDLTLNLYDKSSIICKSGPLLPNLQVSVASFIGNILINIKDRVSKLESTLYDNYLFRNKMMLQNMYSSDDTLFKVALEVMSVRETANNEDSELIELILKNIEPGKENYDRYFMENIIDFYTIIGKISFEVADVLFELIEKQHEEVVDVIVD